MVHSTPFRRLPKTDKDLRLDNARQYVINKKGSLRAAARLFDIPWSTFRAHFNAPDRIPKIAGHPTALRRAEEVLITDSAVEFARNGTPLSREGLKDLVQHFCERLSEERRATIPFINLRPGDNFLSGFFRRNPTLSLKRRCNLEKDRAIAMCPANIAQHYARLQQAYDEYGIKSGEQIFNLDETGFSTRTAYRARAKGVMEAKGRSNSTELKWSANADHVTLMPIVSTYGRAWDPVAIAPGKRAKHRIRPDGIRETPACYLPENARIIYRDPAGMDSDGCYQFCEWFILQTALLRRKHRNILLTLDGYGAHKTFRCLNLLRQNKIVVIALPAHSSHRTQVLDFSIFSPFKTKLRNALNDRILPPEGSIRNGIYTLCELIHNAYKESVTYSNIVNGFKACGVWCAVRRRAIPEVIKITDITNTDGYATRQEAFSSFLDLCTSYRTTRNLLRSDGPVLQNGTLNTRGGALLTSDDVLKELSEREAARAATARARVERDAVAEKRRI